MFTGGRSLEFSRPHKQPKDLNTTQKCLYEKYLAMAARLGVALIPSWCPFNLLRGPKLGIAFRSMSAPRLRGLSIQSRSTDTAKVIAPARYSSWAVLLLTIRAAYPARFINSAQKQEAHFAPRRSPIGVECSSWRGLSFCCDRLSRHFREHSLLSLRLLRTYPPKLTLLALRIKCGLRPGQCVEEEDPLTADAAHRHTFVLLFL